MLPKDACEEIDAAFFSGDTFHDEKVLSEFEWYLSRWTRETARIKRYCNKCGQAWFVHNDDGSCVED